MDNARKNGLKKKIDQYQLHLDFECILYADSNRLLRSQSFIGGNRSNYYYYLFIIIICGIIDG
jgi:hypothetical protein